MLAAKLSSFVPLTRDEEAAIRALTSTFKTFAADDTLVRQGSRPYSVFMILKGVAYRHRNLANGKRQIFGYLLRGDLCDAQFTISNEIDHDVALLTETEVAVFPIHELAACTAAFPSIRQGLMRSMLSDSASLREGLLNIGQRSAPQRLAQFICAMSDRLQKIDGVDGGETCFIPITQLELADTIGLTVVHVSRCLQKLREQRLVHWSRAHLEVLNLEGLRRLAGLDEDHSPVMSARPHALVEFVARDQRRERH